MHIILGRKGHVASAATRPLLTAGEAVTVVTRDASNAEALARLGAEVDEADVGDAASLLRILRRGRRALILHPPADPSTDTDAKEHLTLASIVAALIGSGLGLVVLESTYGAQAGDLSVLHDFEAALRAQPIPAKVLRAAYCMSN